jgi:hypothetical protein
MLNKILITSGVVLLIACGPSPEEERQEAERVAAVTCAIMSETRNMDASVRVANMNEAREKIGGQPYLRGDDVIKEAFEYGLCQALVLDENYDDILQPLKEAKREEQRIIWERLRIEAEENAEKVRIAEIAAAETRAEERRIASEKRAERLRVAAEKQRVADSKPRILKDFHSNGKLWSSITYQSQNDGGKKHGPFEYYYDNGELKSKGNFKDGKENGPYESYYPDGKLESKRNYKDNKKDGHQVDYFSNGQLSWSANYKDGRAHGLSLEYYENGRLRFRDCYENGKEVKFSRCKK